MKKITLLLLGFACTAAIYAQPGNGGFMRRSPEERAAAIHQKLDSAFKLDKEVLARLDTALIALYQAQDKKREEMMAGGMPDRETMMAEMKKFSDARDEMLKTVLKEEEYKIWKEKIEPAMRPQRPPGSGGGNK